MVKANIELHTHPFLGRNSLKNVLNAMDKTEIDILALESLDSSLYPYVIQEAEKISSALKIDSVGIKFPSGKYLLNAREYNTKENLHVLTIGYSLGKANKNTEIRKIIDNGLKENALIILDHPFADNGKTKTAGHISEELEKELEKLCIEYSDKITLEWNGYCIPWIRKTLKTTLNLFGVETKYSNINKKVEELSEKLKNKGYNIPIVVDTDLHARTKRHLNKMGTARISMDIEGECGREIVSSMKDKIFKGEYQNIKKYVSMPHIMGAFCVPILMPKYFKKPRA